VAQFTAVIFALLVAQAFVLSLILTIPFNRFLLPVGLLSSPSLLSGALMYLSRRRGGRRFGLFLAAVIVHFVLFALGLDYSAYRLGFLSLTVARDLIPFIFFTLVPVSVSLYLCFRLRRSAWSQSEEDAHKLLQ
jgi:hypothetical protein